MGCLDFLDRQVAAEDVGAVTFRELIRDAQLRLCQAGVPDPEAEAEALFARFLGLSRPVLRIRYNESVAESAAVGVWEKVEGRCRRVPLQHLFGSAPFLDFDLEVDGSVLVPRPETEGLALRAIEILEQSGLSNPSILDVGTGSGCLAIALSRRFPQALVEAVDVSPKALETARRNAVANGASQIRFRSLDLLGAAPDEYFGLDLLVSNPPYIPEGDIAGLEPEVRDHDPRLALSGGLDGLDFYRHLCRIGTSWVRAGGWMLFEFGDGQSEALSKLFSADGSTVSVEKDLSGRDRLLIVQRPRASID
jgi:release factor glutamine methyltransferase